MSSARAEFWGGFKILLPIWLGVLPSAMITGAAATLAGIPAGAALAMSLFVFAGSAQLLIAQMLPAGTPIWIILFTCLLVSLRLLLYSLSISPYIRHLPGRWRAGLAYLLTDPAYAVGIAHFQQKENLANSHWYLLGAGLSLWLAWQLGNLVGIFLGVQFPAGWPLDFTIPLTFIALIVSAIKDRPMLAAVGAAGLVALLTAGLPYKLGLISALVAGIAAGLWAEGKGS